MILAAALALAAAPISATAIAADSEASIAFMCYPDTQELVIGVTWDRPIGKPGGRVPLNWRTGDAGPWALEALDVTGQDMGFIVADRTRADIIAGLVDKNGGKVSLSLWYGDKGEARFQVDPIELARVRTACPPLTQKGRPRGRPL